MNVTTDQVRAKRMQVLRSDNSDIITCSFAGKLLATGGVDKLVRLWAIDTTCNSKIFAELPQSPFCGHTYAINWCHFSPLGDFLASASQDGRCIIWDVKSGGRLHVFEHPSKTSIRICQFSPNGQMLATGSDDETACFWDLSTKKLIRQLEGHDASVVALCFSPDNSILCTGATSGDMKVWDARFGHGRHLLHFKEAHDLGVTCCQFSPTFGLSDDANCGKNASKYLLATGGNDNLVNLWRVHYDVNKYGKEVTVTLYTAMKGHSMNVMCLSFSHDGNYLASSSGDKAVIIWSPLKGTQLCQITGHNRYVTCCSFSGDARMLATGSGDKTVALWNLSLDNTDDQPLIEFNDDVDPKQIVKPVSEWSLDEVVTWLTLIGMSQYAQMFCDNAIDGQELICLNDRMLLSSLKIEALGHRNKIVRAIRLLKNARLTHSMSVGFASDSGQIKKSGLKMCSCSMLTANPRELELPDEFYCPITHEVMLDPVLAADGYSYDRIAIEAWVNDGRRTSPMTNAPFKHLDLTPNRMLKMLIQKHWSASV